MHSFNLASLPVSQYPLGPATIVQFRSCSATIVHCQSSFENDCSDFCKECPSVSALFKYLLLVLFLYGSFYETANKCLVPRPPTKAYLCKKGIRELTGATLTIPLVSIAVNAVLLLWVFKLTFFTSLLFFLFSHHKAKALSTPSTKPILHNIINIIQWMLTSNL